MSSEEDWDAATWEGSRRAQIRRNLRLTVRQRLEALEALTETSERLVQTSGRPDNSIPRPLSGESVEDSASGQYPAESPKPR